MDPNLYNTTPVATSGVPGGLPPEASQFPPSDPNAFPGAGAGPSGPVDLRSAQPTVRTLPPKVVKTTLPPQYKTVNLPPKVVKTNLPPLYPPGMQPPAGQPPMGPPPMGAPPMGAPPMGQPPMGQPPMGQSMPPM